MRKNISVHGIIGVSINKRRQTMPEEAEKQNAEEAASIASFEENELAGMGKGEEQQEES